MKDPKGFEPLVQEPFNIIIKNNTDEKIFNINVLEPKHSQLEKLTYSSRSSNQSYPFILEHFKNNEVYINHFLFRALCDYPKFVQKQLNSMIYVSGLDKNNPKNIEECYIGYDIFQQQDSIVQLKQGIKFTSDVNIILPYLMPETTIEITMYLTETIQLIPKK